jgi:hypothetical protein
MAFQLIARLLEGKQGSGWDSGVRVGDSGLDAQASKLTPWAVSGGYDCHGWPVDQAELG